MIDAKPTPRRLLAIDTSASPGFAVIEWGGRNKAPKLLYADALKTTTDHTDAERYSAVHAFASLVCFRYGPFDAVVREHFTKGGSKRSTQLVFGAWSARSEEHTSELQSRPHLVCRLLLEKKKNTREMTP